MLGRFRRHLTFANVASGLALFLVLTGTGAYASGLVGADDIKDNAVHSHHIKNGEVTRADLAPPEAWHEVGPGSPSGDLCADPSAIGVFCKLAAPCSATAWANYGGGFATAAYYKDQLGIVRLRGVVTTSSCGVYAGDSYRAPIFRLPASMRPDHGRIFPSVGRKTDSTCCKTWEVQPARVDVDSDGLVAFESDCLSNGVDCSSDGGYLSLDGISFRPDE
jgi:hypothetical protein